MFKKNSNYNSTQWLDVSNEHFINWMQMESFSDFRKLYAKISNGLTAGSYTFLIANSKYYKLLRL